MDGLFELLNGLFQIVEVYEKHGLRGCLVTLLLLAALFACVISAYSGG